MVPSANVNCPESCPVPASYVAFKGVASSTSAHRSGKFSQLIRTFGPALGRQALLDAARVVSVVEAISPGCELVVAGVARLTLAALVVGAEPFEFEQLVATRTAMMANARTGRVDLTGSIGMRITGRRTR